QPSSVTFFLSPAPATDPGALLFPYTTLFRSGSDRSDVARITRRTSPADGRRDDSSRVRRTFTFGVSPCRGRAEFRARRNSERKGDRKSTRLNSSHLVISYAVFCLKKKNQDPR